MDDNNILIETKDGNKTLMINGKLLHSKYSPKREAEKFILSNEEVYKDKKSVLVYGFGLGYHVFELIKKVSEDCLIYVFEFNPKVINICYELGIIDEIKKEKRVVLYTKYNIDSLKEFSCIISKIEDMIIHKSSLQTLSDDFYDFKEIVNNYIISKNAINKFGSLMKKNYEKNLKYNHSDIDEFFNKYKFKEEKVVIVSAGPSLDESLDTLKQLQRKVKIFAVGRALNSLMSNGIKPDMICEIDALDVVYDHLKGYEDLDIPLCYLSTANNLTVSKYNGPKYIFFNDDKSDIKIDTGKSVATAVLSIAIYGEADTIIFLGQDLAYIDGKTHSSYAKCEEIREDDKYIRKVIGVDGKMLPTTSGLLYFKNWIEKKIANNNNIKFINCSKGARIKGAKEMELREMFN